MRFARHWIDLDWIFLSALHSRTAPSSAAASKARAARSPWMTLPASEANIEKRLFRFDCFEESKGECEPEDAKTDCSDELRQELSHFLFFWKSKARERRNEPTFLPPASRSLSFFSLFSNPRRSQRWPLHSSTPSQGWQRRRLPPLLPPLLPRPHRSKPPRNSPRPREASPSSGRRARTRFTTSTRPSRSRR